jgi:hypothetical protein
MNQKTNSQNLNKKEITLESLGQLHQKEIELLYWIRNRFRWGELVIQVRDGLPFRISRAVEYQDF